jgi:hypothetical protein
MIDSSVGVGDQCETAARGLLEFGFSLTQGRIKSTRRQSRQTIMMERVEADRHSGRH